MKIQFEVRRQIYIAIKNKTPDAPALIDMADVATLNRTFALPNPHEPQSTIDGYTFTHVAAMVGNIDALIALKAKAGVSISAMTIEGNSALYHAVAFEKLESVHFLLEQAPWLAHQENIHRISPANRVLDLKDDAFMSDIMDAFSDCHMTPSPEQSARMWSCAFYSISRMISVERCRHLVTLGFSPSVLIESCDGSSCFPHEIAKNQGLNDVARFLRSQFRPLKFQSARSLLPAYEKEKEEMEGALPEELIVLLNNIKLEFDYNASKQAKP